VDVERDAGGVGVITAAGFLRAVLMVGLICCQVCATACYQWDDDRWWWRMQVNRTGHPWQAAVIVAAVAAAVVDGWRGSALFAAVDGLFILIGVLGLIYRIRVNRGRRARVAELAASDIAARRARREELVRRWPPRS
jgi:hypothetical protein